MQKAKELTNGVGGGDSSNKKEKWCGQSFINSRKTVHYIQSVVTQTSDTHFLKGCGALRNY